MPTHLHRPFAGLALAIALSGCAAPSVIQPAAPASARTPDAAAGGALVRAQCSNCHAVERTGASPLPAAPAFRDLSRKYPVSDLQEALAEGMVTAHADMPPTQFQPAEVADIIAWLEALNAPVA